ncbi:transmembrane ascorbate ferrireductase 1-like [Olea europaea subsp. europaea]|uniref:Transmembrane ascorbate ferrireductase 1-like n=1 Tax=Olea europaea subsp. europaea TaxID=158383 RepID=A0A8S0RV64_OLEEU|nr:transmembrane ascorbate ferrireductase 1-like [Olea europaea subsp. europaea]
MLIGFIIIGGEAVMSYKSFKFHNESNIANLYSLHSWLGIGVIVLYGIQWIYGFLIFFYPGGTMTIRSESLPWHILFGIFVYILAVGTATLGYLEKLTFLQNSGLGKYGAEAFLVNFTAIITVLFGVFVFLTILSQPPQEDEHSYSAI